MFLCAHMCTNLHLWSQMYVWVNKSKHSFAESIYQMVSFLVCGLSGIPLSQITALGLNFTNTAFILCKIPADCPTGVCSLLVSVPPWGGKSRSSAICFWIRNSRTGLFVVKMRNYVKTRTMWTWRSWKSEVWAEGICWYKFGFLQLCWTSMLKKSAQVA